MLLASQASALGRRFKPHIEEMRTAFATLAGWRQPLAPVLMLLWARLHNMLARLDRLAERWEGNRLRPPRRRAGARKPGATPRLSTPRAHAWLIRLHQPLAQWAPRMEMLVNDPEIVALCAAAPQAARLLRPWCRAFGLTPPHLARPPAPRKPRPVKPEPPPFAEHSPAQWPYVPTRLRLRVPGLRRSKQAALF